MLGTIVNTVAIIAGSLLGLLFRGGIPKKFTVTMMQAISLAVMLIGFKMALKSDAILLIIFSLVIGSLIGEFINIESRLERLGKLLETRFSKPGSGVAKGFVVASLVFCVGSMAIVGSLESGLSGNHDILFAKSVIDGLGSILFAASLGIGVFRVIDDRLGGSYFHDFTRVHDGDSLGNLGHNRQIMGYQDQSHFLGFAQLLEQIHDFRLNSYIQSGRGFIENNQIGTWRHRHRGHDTL